MRFSRTAEDWRAIIEEQRHSGLNQTQFCRLHSITRSAFFNAKQRLYPDDPKMTAFIPAIPPEPSDPDKISSVDSPPLAIASADGAASQRIVLKMAHCTLQIDAGISPRWLATLLREMAP